MIIEEPGDTGVGVVRYEYPDDVIRRFLEFICRPNRFIVQADPELVFERSMKFRKELVNGRKLAEEPRTEPEGTEPSRDGIVAALELASDRELYAEVDRRTSTPTFPPDPVEAPVSA